MTKWRIMFYEVRWTEDGKRKRRTHNKPRAAINQAKWLRGSGHHAEVYRVQGWNE